MSKVLDITDKLSFDENPKLVIKGKELEVNADASTILKIMGITGDGTNVTAKDVCDMYELLFNEDARKEIDELKIPFKGFQTLVMEAVNLVTGGDDQGEQ